MSALNDEQQKALGRMMLEGFKKGSAEIVKGCLARGADPHVAVQDEGRGAERPAMHWAAYYFNKDCMQALIDHGADVDMRDPAYGQTALHFAVSNSRAEAVAFLMRNGADPVAQDGDGTVVMDVARGLRAEQGYYASLRDSIIASLATLRGPEKEPPRQDAGAPAQEFNDTAKQKGITAPKTASFAQKPKGKGFSL